MIRYLLDEHVPVMYQEQLQLRDPELEVRAIGDSDAPPKQTPDPEILIWCEIHDFHLVTNNRKSMPKHLADHLRAGRHIPGILTLGDDLDIGEVIEKLLLAAGASLEGEYFDRIAYLR